MKYTIGVKKMLLKILAFSSLIGSIILLGYGIMMSDVWSILPLTLSGVLSFALLNALADIVDCLDDIRYHIKNYRNTRDL